MRSRPFLRRRQLLEQHPPLSRGRRVRYAGVTGQGLTKGTVGTVVSEAPSRMDVTPCATQPTVPEEGGAWGVEVDFDGVGRCEVALVDLVLDDA